jgi:hypothetical protein
MKKNIFFSLLMGCVISSVTAQSPWVRPNGKVFTQIGFSAIQYNQMSYNGKLINTVGNVQDVTLQSYSEFGIAKNVELALVLPYKMTQFKVGSTIEKLNGLSNVGLGLKFKLQQKKNILSAGLQLHTKTIQSNNAKGLRTGFDASVIQPYITYGGSQKKWYYYANAAYGYVSNNYSDYIRVGGELGYEIIKNMHLIGVLDFKQIVSKENFYTTDDVSFSKTGFFLDRQSYLATGIKLNTEFVPEKVGANLAIIGAVDANNAPASPSINVGVYVKF